MIGLNLSSEDIFSIEMWANYFCLFFVFIWVLYKKIPIRLVFLAACTVVILAGSFRTEAYNSDTANYLSHYYFHSIESSITFFGISKIEPLHVILMYFSYSFQNWLFLECLASIICIILLYMKDNRSPSFIIISSFVLTLNTSSLRFSLSCIILSVLLISSKNRYFDYLKITILASAAHAVMLASGAFASRRKWVPVAFAAAFFLASLYVASIGERVAIDSQEVKSMGLKSFAVMIALFAHWAYVSTMYSKKDLLLDIGSFSCIFIITALFFPTLNRMIIIGTICFIYSPEYIDISGKSSLARLFYALLCVSIIGPYVYITPDLFYSSTW